MPGVKTVWAKALGFQSTLHCPIGLYFQSISSKIKFENFKMVTAEPYSPSMRHSGLGPHVAALVECPGSWHSFNAFYGMNFSKVKSRCLLCFLWLFLYIEFLKLGVDSSAWMCIWKHLAPAQPIWYSDNECPGSLLYTMFPVPSVAPLRAPELALPHHAQFEEWFTLSLGDRTVMWLRASIPRSQNT